MLHFGPGMHFGSLNCCCCILLHFALVNLGSVKLCEPGSCYVNLCLFFVKLCGSLVDHLCTWALLFIVMQNKNLGSKKAEAQTRIRLKRLGPKKRVDCKKKVCKRLHPRK